MNKTQKDTTRFTLQEPILLWRNIGDTDKLKYTLLNSEIDFCKICGGQASELELIQVVIQPQEDQQKQPCTKKHGTLLQL